MKKLLLFAVMLMLTFGGTIALAQQDGPIIVPDKVLKVVIKAGTNFTVLTRAYGPVPASSPRDEVVTVVKIHTKVTNKNNPSLPTKDIYEFDLSYDKPLVKCAKHGSHEYAHYGKALHSDQAFIRKDLVTEVKKETSTE